MSVFEDWKNTPTPLKLVAISPLLFLGGMLTTTAGLLTAGSIQSAEREAKAAEIIQTLSGDDAKLLKQLPTFDEIYDLKNELSAMKTMHRDKLEALDQLMEAKHALGRDGTTESVKAAKQAVEVYYSQNLPEVLQNINNLRM